jgi:hypothetical protein
MEVTPELIAKIPAENLHVDREQFARVWARAEAVSARLSDLTEETFYVASVARTCRWLARCDLAPVADEPVSAMPETVEDEYGAAVRKSVRMKDVPLSAAKARGVLATLDWAWYGRGRPPLDVTAAVAS